MPAVYPAFFFVLEKGSKSAGNAVIPTYPMHWSHGLQGSLKRCYKHLFPAFINEYYTAKNGLGTIAPRLLSQVKVGTHSPFGERSHTRAHTPKQGCFRWGWYHYPRSIPHVHEHPRAGCQNGKLCRFWVLVGGALEECREPAGQRCAYACRCPEASRPRRAAQTDTAR